LFHNGRACVFGTLSRLFSQHSDSLRVAANPFLQRPNALVFETQSLRTRARGFCCLSKRLGFGAPYFSVGTFGFGFGAAGFGFIRHGADRFPPFLREFAAFFRTSAKLLGLGRFVVAVIVSVIGH